MHRRNLLGLLLAGAGTAALVACKSGTTTTTGGTTTTTGGNLLSGASLTALINGAQSVIAQVNAFLTGIAGAVLSSSAQALVGKITSDITAAEAIVDPLLKQLAADAATQVDPTSLNSLLADAVSLLPQALAAVSHVGARPGAVGTPVDMAALEDHVRQAQQRLAALNAAAAVVRGGELLN